jgi:hypothetical protein
LSCRGALSVDQLRIDPTNAQHPFGVDFHTSHWRNIVAIPTSVTATATAITAAALSKQKRGDQQRGAERHPDLGKPTQTESAIHGSQSSNRDSQVR